MKRLISILIVTAMILAAVPAAFAASADVGTQENPIVIDAFPYSTEIGAGQTVYFVYTDIFLPMFGTYAQKLNIVGNGDPAYNEENTDYVVGYSVTAYCEGMSHIELKADPHGFLNATMVDDYGSGKYTIAITNHSESDVTYYITLEDAPVYEFSGVFVELGDNTVTLNTAAPTIIYEFNTGDSYDGDGNLLVDGPDEGIYVITIKDTAGNVLDGALVANWGNIGYPQDLTGDSKTNSLEWSCNSAGATLLIGVSGVEAEEFVINVTLKQELEEEEEVVVENYENQHTPNAGFIPNVPETDELTYVDITKPHIAVLGADGYYHLNAVSGPILYVDLIHEGANMHNAYYPVEGQPAIHLRGQHNDENGEKVTIDFHAALKKYIDVINAEGLYPMTADLVEFLNVYGRTQGWYKAGYSPFTAINEGTADADTAWMANVCYYANASTVVPEIGANTDSGNQGGTGGIPGAGDNSAVVGVVLAMAVSGAAIITLTKKKFF